MLWPFWRLWFVELLNTEIYREVFPSIKSTFTGEHKSWNLWLPNFMYFFFRQYLHTAVYMKSSLWFVLYLVLAQEPVVFWRVLRRKLGSSAGGDSLRFLVDFLKPTMTKVTYNRLWTTRHQHWYQIHLTGINFQNNVNQNQCDICVDLWANDMKHLSLGYNNHHRHP